MTAKTRTPRRIKTHNPAGTKLVKRFAKASKSEFPHYVAELEWLAPRDPLLKRWGRGE